MSITLVDPDFNLFPSFRCQRLSALESSFSEPETTLGKCKRYARTTLPLLTLIKPIDSLATCVIEMNRMIKGVGELKKGKSVYYPAFRTFLSLGTLFGICLEHSSVPLIRRIFLGIKFLAMSHEIAFAAYRIHQLPRHQLYKVTKLCLFILNTLLSMMSIALQTPFPILSFLAMQVITTVVHSGRQIHKRKYFAFCIHFLMVFIRFDQYARMIMQHFSPEPPAPCRIEKAEPILVLAEPRKEKLTPYESDLERLGIEFLYFTKEGPKKKFLILSAGHEADHNGAFEPWKIFAQIKELSSEYDVRYRTVNSVEALKDEVQKAAKLGDIMGLMIRGHGTATSIRLGNDPVSGRLNLRTISSDIFSGLHPRCVIILDACRTASYPFSLAYKVAWLSQRNTFAANDDAYGTTIKQLDPLEWSFEKPGANVQTRKIIPGADPITTSFKHFFK